MKTISILFITSLSIGVLAAVGLFITGTALAQNATTSNITAGLANLTVLTSANGTAFDPLTGLGQMLFVGQVLNNDTIASKATNVTTQLFSPNGQLIGFSTTTIPSLAPGAIGNFEQKFTDLDIVGGTPSVMFYQHDTNEKSVPFFGFVPPPPLLTGAIPGGTGAGGAIGAAAGGGAAGGSIGGGGFSGGGGGGGTTINQEIIKCIINQANVIGGNVSGGNTAQNNFAVCKGKIEQQAQAPKNIVENKTTPLPAAVAPTPAPAGPDESCLFDASQPKCIAVNGECPDGFNLNEDGNCFPQHDKCPSGYHSQEDDETGQCYPDSQSCDPGFIIDPDFPTCSKKDDVCNKHPELNECKPVAAALKTQPTNQTQPLECKEGIEEEVDGVCQPIKQEPQQQEPTDTLALQQSNQATNEPPVVEDEPKQDDEPQQEEDTENNNNND